MKKKSFIFEKSVCSQQQQQQQQKYFLKNKFILEVEMEYCKLIKYQAEPEEKLSKSLGNMSC